MKTKLLKKWRLVCKLFKIKSKFHTESSAYRSAFGDVFFCWFIKHHHLYEAIKLECDLTGSKLSGIWKKNHLLHKKYAPSCRFKSKSFKYVCDIDFSLMYQNIIRSLGVPKDFLQAQNHFYARGYFNTDNKDTDFRLKF